MCTTLALYLGLWSWHAQPAENETHNLVGVQCEALFVGHLKNSLGKESWVVGVELLRHEISDDWVLKFGAGFRSGYENPEMQHSNDVQPFFGGGFEYDLSEHMAVDFTFALSAATVGFKFTF